MTPFGGYFYLKELGGRFDCPSFPNKIRCLSLGVNGRFVCTGLIEVDTNELSAICDSNN